MCGVVVWCVCYEVDEVLDNNKHANQVIVKRKQNNTQPPAIHCHTLLFWERRKNELDEMAADIYERLDAEEDDRCHHERSGH